MPNTPIIQLLEENELNVSALYALYAQKIPAKCTFWNQLSREEISHAASIKNDCLGLNLEQAIAENNFSRGIITYVMDFVLAEIERAQNNAVSHFDALNTALRIERSMLEKKCFDIFAPTNITLKELFEKLNTETEQHTKVLTEELKRFN
ncbi:MAG: hypothetical protein WC848_01050 [Parcubacteria group bacterium]|jgi:hypothetical protein